MGQKETKTRLKMPNDDATSTSSGGGGKKSSSGGNGAAASATSPAVEKVEKTNSSGEIKKKSDKSSSTNGSSGGGGGGGDKKASRKDKKEAKAARRGKVSDKVAAQVEELERDGVGEGELVFNSTPGVKVTRDDFELMTLIGKGSFGKVMQVRKRDTQQIYAMKVLRKEAIIARKQVTHTQAEKAILAKIQHPFIVKLHYAFQTKEKLYMILDYINGGELFFHLKREGRFPEERVRFYAAEIISAISHLHSLDIVYRDLKPENILLDRDGHVVITDFGLSKEIDQDEGTHTFCVPEDHQLLTSRGFMDLDTYRAESARDHSLLVAGYDARAKTLLFEAPHRLVEYASATRTLVELESADAADAVSMLVTPDHDLVAQLGECTPSRKFVPRQQSADYAKVKASELLAGKHGAVRQLAVADAGVGERADAPQIAELGLADDDDKAARFYELYGLVLGGAVAERRGVLRFDNVSADARQWLCETFELLGAGVVSGVVVRIADAAWQRALCDSIDGERVFASWVWRLGTSALRAVLRGLIRADESASSVSVSSSSTVFTSSAALRDEIVRLALMAGYSAHFACAGGADSAVSWAISFAESSSPVLQVSRNEVRERAYTGRVWCFTMPSGHVWVRRVHAKSDDGVVSSASRAILTGNCGTPEYLAPEVLKGQGHGMGVDWWSLGTLLFEMMTGLPPFFSQNINIMYQKILNGELKFPSHMSPEAQSLLSGFLTRDPEQRLGSRETGGEIKIKQHPWFAVYDWDKLDRKQIPPPWVPEVSDELDVGQIDSTFTAEAPTDSPENDSPIGGATGKDANFSGFTFQPDSVLEN